MQGSNHTIASALSWGMEQLRESGISTPQLDAEVLLAHSLSVDRVKLYSYPERRLLRQEWDCYVHCIVRRRQRMPVAYITGQKEFFSLSFKVSPAVLIPRPETEILVEEIVRCVRETMNCLSSLTLLEIGTGSGAIAVSVLNAVEELRVVATDISLEIIKLAQENARVHKVISRITFFVAPYLHALRPDAAHFNFIVSNPPYLSASEWKQSEPEIQRYEPRVALLAGEEGLECYRAILLDAGTFLTSRGWLLLEIGARQAQIVSEMIMRTGKFYSPLLVKDLAGIPRVVKAQRR